jgi:hypothetical protein
MTEPTAGPIDDLGVVDPLRVPPVVGRVVRRLPLVGWLFVALAIVHVALEVPGRDVSSPLTLVGLIGRALVVLLPAVVLWRRPDAFAVTPGIVIGAILVAAGALGPVLVRSLDAWLPASAEPELPPLVDLPHLVVGIVFVAARAVGWLSIAVWLAALRPDPAGPAAVLVARVVAAAAVVGTVVSLVALYLDVTPADAVAIEAGSLALALLFAVATIVWAYVAWVLVRQAGLLPRAATILAAAAVVLLVLVELVEVGTSLLLVATRSAEFQDLSIASLRATSYGFFAAMVALVAAFALGLGDPGREPSAAPAESTSA